MLRHENACTALPPNLRGLLATPRIFQEEIPIRFAERIRWIEQVGQVRYHQIQHVFLCLFWRGKQYQTCPKSSLSRVWIPPSIQTLWDRTCLRSGFEFDWRSRDKLSICIFVFALWQVNEWKDVPELVESHLKHTAARSSKGYELSLLSNWENGRSTKWCSDSEYPKVV